VQLTLLYTTSAIVGNRLASVEKPERNET